MTEIRPDMHINGVSSTPGGHYRSASIDGVIKVEGALQVDGLARMNGVVTVRGDLKAHELEGDGKFKVQGRLSAGTARINGLADVAGSVDGEHMILKGMLSVKGDCAVERFEAEGGFEVGGLLNAGTVDIRLYGRGKAREIGGESIRVRKMARSAWKKIWEWMFPKWNPEMEADVIEGDDVDLENTIAKVVRGNRVVLGPGCRIGRVEYRSELIRHPGAKANEEVKTGA